MAERSAPTGLPYKLAGDLLYRYIWTVQRTSTWVPHLSEIEGRRIARKITSHHPFIFAMWHGQFMLLPLLYLPGCPTEVMVARHGDAAIASALLERFDMKLIRGAGSGGRKKDRGGTHAIRAAQEALRSGTSVAMTADVPPGPARRAGMGIVTLARITGRPIVPVAIASSRYLALNTWSRMTLNLPFSRCGVAVADAIHVPHDIDAGEQEATRQLVEARLNEATREAYAKAGADDPVVARTSPTVAEGGGLALSGYRAGMRLLAPAAPAYLRLREGGDTDGAVRRGERMGVTDFARPEGALTWVHVANREEATAARSLVDSLMEHRPNLSMLLTSGRRAMSSLRSETLGSRVLTQQAPLDLPAYATRFLDQWQPELAVFTGSTLPPNLVLEASGRRVPLVLADARLSDRAYRRWQRSGAMARALFGRLDLVLAQNDVQVRRFTRLGARDVRVCGNLRFDAPAPLLDLAERDRLASAIAGRAVLLAAGIHPSEEPMVCEAAQALARSRPGLLSVIIPSRPERGAALAAALRKRGLAVAERRLSELPGPRHDVYLADDVGEMGLFYSLGSVTFMGGSTVPRHAASPLEAIRLGSAVLAGPHVQSFKDAYRELIRRKGARQVSSAEELTRVVAELSANAAELETMRSNAQDALRHLGGALGRTLDALDRFLPGRAAEPARKAG